MTAGRLPNALQVADPLHVIRLANQRLDDVRHRTQNEPSDTEAAKLARCIGYAGSSPPPRTYQRPARHGYVASSKPATPTAKSAQPDTRPKPSETSTRSTNRLFASPIHPPASPTTSRTRPSRPEVNKPRRTIARWTPQIAD